MGSLEKLGTQSVDVLAACENRIADAISMWYIGRVKHIIKVEVLKEYRLCLEFADGTTGTADVSRLVGKGIFSLWNDYVEFRKVQIGSSGELVWGNQVDLCPDALYMMVTGQPRPRDCLKAARLTRDGRDGVKQDEISKKLCFVAYRALRWLRPLCLAHAKLSSPC